MFYKEILPPSSLAKYIDRYFLLGVSQSNNVPGKQELVIPDGTFGLLFMQNKFIKRYGLQENAHAQILKSSYFFGQKSKSVYYVLENESTLSFGIKIKPAGLSLFTKIPGGAITDLVCPTDEILDKQFFNVEERIFEVGNFIKKTELINNYLFRRLNILVSDSPSMLDNILNLIHFHKGRINLQFIKSKFDLDYKKIERLFYRDVGLNPKSYLKIIRFNSTLNFYDKNNQYNLTQLALNSGYYDQNHFVKEVKQFTNLTPKEYYNNNCSALGSKLRKGIVSKLNLLNN